MNKVSYNTITAADIAALRGIIGAEERVIAGDAVGEDYSHDELSGVRRFPEALIKVLTAEEVAGVLKYANSRLIPVTPRGQGTGLVAARCRLRAVFCWI